MKKIFKTIVVGLTMFVAIPVTAQDLIARQAPIDRRMKRVDTLALQSLVNRENEISPSAELYSEWDNTYAHKATELPDSFRIDLRHFSMPTPSRVITSNFGTRWGRKHLGLDIKVYIGDTIRAAFSGKVRIVKYERGGYGKYIVIRHPNGLETIYGHLSKQLVTENQSVRAGEVIGLGGSTGRSSGSHLHFETRLCGVALNPAIFFNFREQDITCDTYMFRRNKYNEDGEEATRLRGKYKDSYTRAEVTGQSVEQEKVTASSEKMYHKVAKGETLSSIAAKRGTTIDALCRLNNLRKTTRLRPGQMLRYT